MTPVAPRSNQPQSLEDILAPHVGITIAGGSYRCTCLHTYERAFVINETPEGQPVYDPEQRLIVDALHTQHQVERLLAAGVEPPRPKDPREAMRQRLGGRS